MFLSKSNSFLLHFWVGFLIICIGFLKFNSCVGDTTTGTSGCLKRERQALIHFKQGLKDPSNRFSSWVGDDCCRWAGIHCSNKTGHVVKLVLRGPFEIQSSSPIATYNDFEAAFNRSCISGEINPSLLGLKYLKHLDLSINCFGGRVIPKFISSFKNLRYLNLSSSGFGGRVPHELGNLSTLSYLDLNDYRFIMVNSSDGVSYESINVPTYDLHVDRLDWLFGLSSLQYLDMGSVNLSMATNWLPSINMLPSILNLHLSYCHLPNISTTLPHVNLTSLSTLDLSGNRLGPQIPTWVFNNSRLVSLDLRGNGLSGHLHDWLGQFINLTSLYLSSNSLSGPIPPSLGRLSSLRELYLFENSLSGPIPSSLGRLSSLRQLALSYNSLSGPIPPSLGRLSSLRELYLSTNSISGSIPPSIGKLSSLRIVDLSENSLSGSIPPSLGRLSSLRELYLDVNSIFGSIPPSLGRLSSLRDLSLSDNSLSGPIPPSLGRLSSLEALYLQSNKLNGSIPESLGQLSTLESLFLFNNSFKCILTESHFSNLIKLKELYISSTSLVFNVSSNWVPPFQLTYFKMDDCKLGPQFPLWLQTQKRLFYLSLSNASISDVISNLFHNLSSNITYLDLSSNHLKGSIPLSICQMKDLIYLSFSNNQLTRAIPQCLWDLQNLEMVDLENNFLSGGILSSKSNLSSLTSLHLSKNKLSGELPPSMKSCTRLITLDLRENKFSGTIPKWIGENLTSLMFLILRSNMFKGNIPPQLSLLSELQVLDLSQNNLSGKIPKSFGNFSAMAMVNKTKKSIYSAMHFSDHLESIWVLWKGSQYEYSSTISLVININLSENDLDGEIPEGITHLFGLQSLNLSKNQLIGTVPENISDVRWLESLDLSWNRLSGMIPHTLSYMTSLNHLNLSYNNFSGRIPSGRQLDTINDSSIYTGNPLLCGPPLLNQCSGDEIFPDSRPLSDGDKEAEDELEIQLLFISMGPGFVLGFWVVCGILLFKRSWRVAYYNFFDDMGDRLYVAVARKLAKFKTNKGLQGNRGIPSTPKHVLHLCALPSHKSS